MSAKQLARIAILAALCIALRFAFGTFPNIKPITAIFLVSLFYLPVLESWLVMAVTMVGSGLIFGGGLVVLWQVMSYTVILLLWRLAVVPWAKGMGMRWLPLAAVLAGVVTMLYGFFISIPLAIIYQTNFLVFWFNGLTFDAAHALSTALFYPIIYSIFRRSIPHEKNFTKP